MPIKSLISYLSLLVMAMSKILFFKEMLGDRIYTLYCIKIIMSIECPHKI